MSVTKAYLDELMNEPRKDITWFKDGIEPKMKGFKIEYKYWEEGDFGSLNQIEFNSKKIGGEIDFWGLGFLGIFLWDYETDKEIMNVLLEKHQEKEQKSAFKKLLKHLLKIKKE